MGASYTSWLPLITTSQCYLIGETINSADYRISKSALGIRLRAPASEVL